MKARTAVALPCFGALIALSVMLNSSISADDRAGRHDGTSEISFPGPDHRHLEGFIGAWDANVMLYDGQQTPIRSSGTLTSRWTLGGRFVSQQFEGTIGTSLVHGMGLLGFDRVSQQFVSSWADTTSTSLQVCYGTFSEGKQKFSLRGPGQVGQAQSMVELQIHGKDSYSYSLYRANGEKSLEIGFTRHP